MFWHIAGGSAVVAFEIAMLASERFAAWVLDRVFSSDFRLRHLTETEPAALLWVDVAIPPGQIPGPRAAEGKPPSTSPCPSSRRPMDKRIFIPTGDGPVLLDAHPAGCATTVADMAAAVTPLPRHPSRRPTVVVVGSSNGHGLAATVAGLVQHGIRGVGVADERPPAAGPGSAGWYRTAAAALVAAGHRAEFEFVNADLFADSTKAEVAAILGDHFGAVDFLIYAPACGRRTDPDTGQLHTVAIKPLGTPVDIRTLSFDTDGSADVYTETITPATDAQKASTVAVAGGADWQRWINALAKADLLADGFRTVAVTYIGSRLTAPIYQHGTLGAAKLHLEATARTITDILDEVHGHAYACATGAAVTDSALAVPGMALYLSALRAVVGDALVPPIRQAERLWSQLTGWEPLALDQSGLIRLDGWELDEKVQAQVTRRFQSATTETVEQVAALDWFRAAFRAEVYGFDVPGVDYTAVADINVPWPRLRAAAV